MFTILDYLENYKNVMIKDVHWNNIDNLLCAILVYIPLKTYSTTKNLEDFYTRTAGGEYFYFSTKAPRAYTEIKYPENCYLIFGKESAGIPEDILKQNLDRCVRIPMRENLRSLNLSNSAAIAVYEVLRQSNFANLESEGFLSLLYNN